MCGRFGFTRSKKEIQELFGLKELPDAVPPLFNIAPQQNVPAVLNASQQRLSLVRWGLVPHWSREEKPKLNLINARAETLLEKPMFKGLVASKRCLILADAFYEWKKTNFGKVPYRIFLKGQKAFAFAGLWDTWQGKDKIITTCLIITTQANQLVATLHDRMPVILSRKDEAVWLLDTDMNKVTGCLKPFDSDKMDAYQISSLINSPGNNSAEVIEPVV